MKILTQNLQLKVCSKDTINRANDVFSYIDSDFTDWKIDVKSPKTEATKMAMLEMDKDATFADIFGEISNDADLLRLTQAQIIEFVTSYKDQLRTDGYATFFLFKENDEFFIALVRFVGVGQLKVSVFRFSDDFVWFAEYRRVVVPQLALKKVELSLSDSDALSLAIETVKKAGYQVSKIY